MKPIPLFLEVLFWNLTSIFIKFRLVLLILSSMDIFFPVFSSTLPTWRLLPDMLPVYSSFGWMVSIFQSFLKYHAFQICDRSHSCPLAFVHSSLGYVVLEEPSPVLNKLEGEWHMVLKVILLVLQSRWRKGIGGGWQCSLVTHYNF